MRYVVFFFFKQKTAYEMRISDWSSDVCSSDLLPPADSAKELQRGIQAELDRVDGQMSTYKPQSALSRFNRAPAGSWQTLPPEFFDLLQHALQLAKDSDGAYDPTVGPLGNLWGFGPDQRARQPPPDGAIAQAKAPVGRGKLKRGRAR